LKDKKGYFDILIGKNVSKRNEYLLKIDYVNRYVNNTEKNCVLRSSF